jgi:hypothetical protein
LLGRGVDDRMLGAQDYIHRCRPRIVQTLTDIADGLAIVFKPGSVPLSIPLK